MKYLSLGCNLKLSLTVASFNLPSVLTCPGQTLICKKVCYAQKADRFYLTARKKRLQNYKFSLKPEFVDTIIAEIRDNGIQKLRIHESGDFYSQTYVNKWLKIIKENPQCKFLAFSKSFHLKFPSIDNFILYWSVDDNNLLKKKDPSVPLSYLSLNGSIPSLIKDPYLCIPVGKDKYGKRDKSHYHYCGGKCLVCWDSKRNIVFQKH